MQQLAEEAGVAACPAQGRGLVVTRSHPMTTLCFALSPAEWLTTAVAAAVSTGAYLAGGQAYLSRGVLGDLLGLLVLAAVGTRLQARLRHEALLCLALIGLVVAVGPRWPLTVAEPLWWALFLAGLSGYLVLRRRLCRAAPAGAGRQPGV